MLDFDPEGPGSIPTRGLTVSLIDNESFDFLLSKIGLPRICCNLSMALCQLGRKRNTSGSS